MSEHRFELERIEDGTDRDLASADEELRGEEAIHSLMGAGDEATPLDLDQDIDDCPFEMAVAQPRAVSLFNLYELLSQKVPPEIAAAVGKARTPILIIHQMTPFPRFGYPATRVWGMGYLVQNLPESLVPVDYAPRSELLEVGKAEADMKVSFSASGKFDLTSTAMEVANAIPGVSIEGLSYGLNAKNNLVLAFSLKLELLKIMAGLVGRGVRWDFIEQDERLDRGTKMLQTVLLPPNLRAVEMDIEVWVRRRRALLGGGAARSWRMAPKRLTVDVE